jgi:SAM-dependent methyltransferase
MGEYFKSDTWKVLAQQDLPFLPTPFEAIEETFRFLDTQGLLKNRQSLIDLGAGDGRVIQYAAEKYRIHSTGVEVNLELIQSGQQEIQKSGLQNLCELVEGDLYDFPVSDADIIFCFILPSSHRYFTHVVKEIKPQALVVSVRWPLEKFNEYWEKEYKIDPLGNFSIFIYIKK